jgi:predicted GNAT superfamily acetyltransferase
MAPDPIAPLDADAASQPEPGGGSATAGGSRHAGAAPAVDEVTVRQLAGHDDYRACFELQLATWGRAFEEAVPPSVLKISQRVGGIAAGAFAGDGRLLGFVYGLTGVRPPGGRRAPGTGKGPGGGAAAGPAAGAAAGSAAVSATGPAAGSPAGPAAAAAPRLLHWSHMLAVAPGARDLRLGTRLKLYQRELLLALGVEEVEWTYDPLEARNAHLNFNLLGAEAVEYVEDMYEGEMGSELARGLGTDRFIVLWRLADERARAAAARAAGGSSGAPAAQAPAPAAVGGAAADAVPGSPAAVAAARFAAAPIVDAAPATPAAPAGAGLAALPEAPRVRIEVPARIQDFKDREPARALAYRHGTRRAFETYLARGYRVTSFYRDSDGRCFYGVEA